MVSSTRLLKVLQFLNTLVGLIQDLSGPSIVGQSYFLDSPARRSWFGVPLPTIFEGEIFSLSRPLNVNKYGLSDPSYSPKLGGDILNRRACYIMSIARPSS